jgi:dihydrofolate reductase
MSKTISIIVAVAEDNGIGFENRLLTHISADLKHFKQVTNGHAIVMGRNTWFSLPNRPLPNRTNIVITNVPGEFFEGAVTVYSIEEAMAKCPENEESFIIGGAMIYLQFFPLAHKLYLTKMHKTFPADTFFPDVLPTEWTEVSKEDVDTDEQAGLAYSFVILERNK